MTHVFHFSSVLPSVGIEVDLVAIFKVTPARRAYLNSPAEAAQISIKSIMSCDDEPLCDVDDAHVTDQLGAPDMERRMLEQANDEIGDTEADAGDMCRDYAMDI